MKYRTYHLISTIFIFDTIFRFDNVCRLHKMPHKIRKSLVAYRVCCFILLKTRLLLNSKNFNKF